MPVCGNDTQDKYILHVELMSDLLSFLDWLLSVGMWHVFTPAWQWIVLPLIGQEWYVDLADWVGRTFPGMNW